MAGPVRRLRRGRRHRLEDDQEEYTEAAIKSEPTLLSEYTHDESVNGNESSDDWQPDTNTTDAVAPRKSTSTKVTRGAAVGPSVTVSRSASRSPEQSKLSIHLTVKMPSSKLREVTNSSGRTSSGRRNVNVFTDNPIVSGPRSSRTKKKLVEIDTSDEEDSDGEGADGLEDAPGEDDDDEEEAEDDDSLDADGDVDMDDISPQPPISKRANRLAAMAPPTKGKPIKGVEEKEMELAEDDDDEELSELDSDAEGEADETLLQDDEMGEGGEDEELDEEDEDDEEVEEDLEEDGTPATGSRASTPDYNKLTKRQRGSLGSDFLQLPMEPQVKKHLTAEEHAMRRAEMARRRKNLSEKRNEEEKMDTINRLLKKQAPKRRGRFPVADAAADGTPDVLGETEKADPTMIRWINTRDSCKVALPEDILGTPVAQAFGDLSKAPSGRKLVEEV